MQLRRSALAAGTTLTIITFTPGELSGMFRGDFQLEHGTYINLGNGLTAGLLYNDSLGTVQYEFVATPSTTADTWTAGATGPWATAADWSNGAPDLLHGRHPRCGRQRHVGGRRYGRQPDA